MRHSFLMAATTAFRAVSSNSTFAQYSHRHWRRQACAMSRTFGGRHFANVEKLRVFPLPQNSRCSSRRDCWRRHAPFPVFLLTSFLSGRFSSRRDCWRRHAPFPVFLLTSFLSGRFSSRRDCWRRHAPFPVFLLTSFLSGRFSSRRDCWRRHAPFPFFLLTSFLSGRFSSRRDCWRRHAPFPFFLLTSFLSGRFSSRRDCWRRDAPFPFFLLTSFLSGRGVAISSKKLVADASAVRSRLTGFHLMSCFFTVRLLTPSSELHFRKEQVPFTTSNSTRRVLCLSLMFCLSDGTRSR